ncbi:MAG: Gfo/Idh/MocA family oxidoreductase [Armatimonadetes bacterium]|nr:Gfo/Idh/MocA family oxidoreductase [Armatimonadota bacterium]MDW8121903.1 Gfo/Idh/MocA family oxidoreductase [Armatimonadota bacterium]
MNPPNQQTPPQAPDQPIKVAVIGTGDVARKSYLPGLNAPDRGIRLTAVCDIVAERAQWAQETFGADTFYSDLSQMLEKDESDFVFVLTPLLTHAAIVRQVLQSGRHCYSEKPLTLSLREADELGELAEQRKVHLLCAPVMPLLPPVQFLRKILREQVIGKVTFVRAHSSHGGPERGTFATDTGQYYRKETAGPCAPLYDMGVYALTCLTYILGPVKRVAAFAGIAIAERTISKVTDPGFTPYTLKITTNDNCALLLDFGEGCFATLDASFCIPYRRGPGYEFYGSQGGLTADLWSDEIWIARETVNEGRWQPLPLPDEFKRTDRLPWGVLVVQHLRHLLTTKDRSPISVASARHIVEIMEKALLSAETGSVQSLSSTLP